MKKDWSRYEEAKRLKETGVKIKDIAKALGVSATRVGQMLYAIRDREKFQSAGNIECWSSGLEKYTVTELYRCNITSKEQCISLFSNDLDIVYKSVVVRIQYPKYYEEHHISLRSVNDVRKWLGLPEYISEEHAFRLAYEKTLLNKRIESAAKFLHKHGWKCSPPD